MCEWIVGVLLVKFNYNYVKLCGYLQARCIPAKSSFFEKRWFYIDFIYSMSYLFYIETFFLSIKKNIYIFYKFSKQNHTFDRNYYKKYLLKGYIRCELFLTSIGSDHNNYLRA